MMELKNGNCMELLKEIPDGSVDLIVTDPPYGLMDTDGGRRMGINGWDQRVNSAEMLQAFERVLRPNGKAVVCSMGSYTVELLTSAPPALPFSYRAVWLKDQFANSLGVNKAMVSVYEDVCIFSKIAPKHDFDGCNPLREYFLQVLEYIGPDPAKARKTVINTIGGRADHTTRVNSTQFTLCTERVYQEITERFALDKMQGFRQYADLRATEDAYRAALIERMNTEAPSVFNLWEGGKYKSNVLKYPKDRDGFHPTQKPLALMEDLIKTFSNPGHTVLDPFMGSGSTGVACVNTGRKFIGMELDQQYFEIAQRRIWEAIEKREVILNGQPGADDRPL
jgi:site-specific DNA-methyltransferase (adenine-specific)